MAACAREWGHAVDRSDFEVLQRAVLPAFAPLLRKHGQAHRHGFSDLGRGFCACVPRSRVLLMLVGTHELHPGQVQPGPGSGVERSKEKEKITAGIGA